MPSQSVINIISCRFDSVEIKRLQKGRKCDSVSASNQQAKQHNWIWERNTKQRSAVYFPKERIAEQEGRSQCAASGAELMAGEKGAMVEAQKDVISCWVFLEREVHWQLAATAICRFPVMITLFILQWHPACFIQLLCLCWMVVLTPWSFFASISTWNSSSWIHCEDKNKMHISAKEPSAKYSTNQIWVVYSRLTTTFPVLSIFQKIYKIIISYVASEDFL